MSEQPSESTLTTTLRQHQSVLISLPLMILGLFLVVFALFNAAWPPNYENVPFGETASHWGRMTGDDAPEQFPGGPAFEVERPPAYMVLQLLDGLIYVALLVATGSVVALAWMGDRGLYLPLIIISMYGILYCVGLGLVIGPMIAISGFALILLSATLGWVMTTTATTTEVQDPQITTTQGAGL